MKSKSFLLKFLIIFLIVFILTSIIFNIYFDIIYSYDTFVINKSTTEKKIESVGLIYKDELVINFDNNGCLLKNLYSDGAKIGVDFEVSRIYKTNEDALKFENIKILKEKIKNLEEIKNTSSISNINIAEINNNINNTYDCFLEDIKKNNLNNINIKKRKLISLFNKKYFTINKNIDYEDNIKKLQTEKEKLEEEINNTNSIISPKSGYFVGGVDGFEEECSLKNINKFDIDEFINFLKKIKNKKIANKNKIKIITSPRLKFKAVVPTNFFSYMSIGFDCIIRFKATGEEIEATLEDSILDFNKKESLATFSINSMTQKLASLRKSEVEILLKKYDSFKIPKQAIKLNKSGEIGVYVIEGNYIKFKTINILDEDKNFFIASVKAANESQKSKYLKNFDKIVLKGSDLYDNKQV